jgi:putative addiction module component (TIGR02574 family)
MAPTMRTFGIDRLSLDDRLALVQEICDSIAEDPELLPLSEEQKQLLGRRAADLTANPGHVLTWEEIKRSVRGER